MQIQRDILKEAGISPKDIRQLETVWNEYQAAAARPIHQIPHIVCTGIYNAGKSTLLNALTDSELFPTGDIPTTKEIVEVKYGGAVYVDTPGLNAENEDDHETATAYENADLILFVSNVQNGGLLESEVKWLEHLRERFFTAALLNEKIIYVLSHCGQVDEDQLPVIREKFEADISLVLGTRPQTLFLTDALVYTQGRIQKENLLVEFSQIQTLRTYLTERVQNATGSREADHQQQLELAGQNCLAALAEIEEYCRKKTDDLERTLAQQKQDLKNVWSEFSSKLESVLSNRPSPYISRYMDHPSFRSYSEVQDTSESGVKRKAADCLRSRYNDRESTLRKSVRQAKEELAPYLRKGPGSKYWNICSQVNQEFEAFILKLLQMSVPIEQGESISVEPDLDSGFQSEIEQELQDDVVRGDHYYSLEFYIEQECDVSEYEEQVKGLFGILTMKTIYHIWNQGDAEREWQSDMDKAWNSNCDRVERRISLVVDRFMQSLTSAANSRKTILEKQLNAYLGNMKPDGNGEIYQQALEHIARLKEEVSQ